MSIGEQIRDAVLSLESYLSSILTFVEQMAGVGVTIVDKFGDDDAVDSNADKADLWPLGSNANRDVWWVPGGTIPTFKSTDNLDVGVVTLQGLDLAGASQEESVTLTGTTLKSATKTFTVIYRETYEAAIPGHGPLGTVTTYKADGTTAIAVLREDEGQTFQAFFVIPAWKIGYLCCAHKEAGKGDEIVAHLFVRPAGGNTWKAKFIFRGSDGRTTHVWAPTWAPSLSPVTMVAGTQIKLALTQIGGTRCSGGYRIALVDA